MTELIGKTLGKYQIVARVGRGGMARVYKAYQPSLDRNVALKVLHKHLAEDPDFVDRFEREATAVARLRHPSIVQVYDYDHVDELYYIVMEFIEGPTLKAEISERLKHLPDGSTGIFRLDEIGRVFVNLADAIDYAHSRGMIHRDLKPGNIMFTPEGQILLTDFGLAQMAFARQSYPAGALSGTPAYMSPEQVQGGHIDERSDIYSLGVILYELLTGRVPFTADSPYAIMTKHVTEEVPQLSIFNPDIPGEVETAVLIALSKEPETRYKTANDFSYALQEALGMAFTPLVGSGFAPVATLADSQELMPISTVAGVTPTGFASITSPYRGLFAFREEDAPYFFGRELFTQRLTDTLYTRTMAAVIGPSGSGKSSVVFAGLLPRLREHQQWSIFVMRPGIQPFESLAGALVSELEPNLSDVDRLAEIKHLAAALKTDELSLVDVLRKIAKKNGHLDKQLLVVDQFEELYTLCKDPVIRKSFPNTIFEAIYTSKDHADLDFSLVLTLRADFMGQALTHRPFADALQDADVKLGPMTRAELARAVESPAAKKRVVFEAGLVDRILDDVGDEPGNLPLLEFALTLLWDRRSGIRLTHAAYETIGRVEGSLARYADEIYEQLDTADQIRARRIFTQMVRPGEGTEDTRRLAGRQELGKDDWPLVQHLADARLVVTTMTPEGVETVEVVHEALIRGWNRLRGWMNAERAFRSWQERLRVALNQWERSTQDEGALLRGAPLAEAEDWLATKKNDLSVHEQAFIQASIELREKRLAEREAQRQRQLEAARELAEEQHRRAESEYQRAEEQARSTRNFRRLAIVLAAIFLLAVGAAIWAIGESKDAAQQADARATEVVIRSTAESVAKENANLAATRAAESAIAQARAEQQQLRADDAAGEAFMAKEEAENERDRADQQAQLALARQLAAQSTTLIGPQYDLALLLSLEANNIRDTAETQSAILAALQGNPTLARYLRRHPTLLQSIDFSPDGQLLATCGGEGLVFLWKLETGEVFRRLIGHDPTQLVNRVVFSPDGSQLATASDDLSIIIWDADSGKLINRLEGHTAWVQSIDYSPDGSYIISGAGDRTMILWDSQSGDPIRTFIGHNGPLWDVAYSHDGSLIASASGDGTVGIWNPDTGARIHDIAAHTGAAFNVAFSPDDSLIASGGGDNLLKLWDTQTGEQVGDPITGHAAGVVGVIFSPDGSQIATSSADSTVRLWDVESRQQTGVMTNHNGLVPDVTYSPDGMELASGDGTGTAIIWDISGQPTLGTMMTSNNGGVTDLDIQYEGDLMISSGVDGTIRFWDAKNGIQVAEPITHALRITETVTALDLARDGRLISGSKNGTIVFWQDGEPGDNPFSALPNGVSSIAISADGMRAIAGGEIGISAIFDLTSETQIGPAIPGHSGPVRSVAISQDGQMFATGGQDGYVNIRNLAEIQAGQPVGVALTPMVYSTTVPAQITSLTFTPDAGQLISSDNLGNLVLWDVANREVIRQINLGQEVAITQLAIDPVGLSVAVADSSGNASIYAVEDLELIESGVIKLEESIRDLAFGLDGHLWAITDSGHIQVISYATKTLEEDFSVDGIFGAASLKIYPDGRQIVAGFDDGLIRTITVSNEGFDVFEIIHAEPFLGIVNVVNFSPDGTYFVSGGNDGAIVFWDVDTHQPIGEPLIDHTNAVVNAQFTQDGRYLVSGSCSMLHISGNCIHGEAIVWDVSARAPVRVITDTVGFTQAIALSPDGRTLALTDCGRVEVAGACLEGNVRLIELFTGKNIRSLRGHTSFIWSADFSPDGTFLASGSADNTIIIWDVNSGDPVGQTLANHGGPVRRVSFDPTGRKLASAGFDFNVFLWDVDSGQAIAGPIVTYTQIAMDAVFSSDSARLISGSTDGTITISEVDLASWREKACKVANRDLRQEEWELFFAHLPYRQTCTDNLD